jgi:hypothetical protein
MRLLKETLDLLINRPAWLKLSIIESETGLKSDWLSLLQLNKIPNPGVVGIEKLNDYLKAKLHV